MTTIKVSRILLFTVFSLIYVTLTAQPASSYPEATPDRFDFGKLWTFEDPPLDYFESTYDFRPTQEWLDRSRMSALRFATYCSASFISPDGLIITNHHCSRGEAGKVMKDGEDFDENGFYAPTRTEERSVPDLFVKQLVKIADITKSVKQYTDQATTDEEFETQQQKGIQAAMKSYMGKEDWQGLEVEPVTYYSGGAYSLYGYKKYDDVRLVLIPELELGFFGGDFDNFTYPRYNLDFTIWRVYENGKPVNSSDFHFDVNPAGPSEGEVVFAISNPGSTERYRTMAQLTYDRDYRYKIQTEWLRHRMQIMKEMYKENPSFELKEQIFNFSNSVKAFDGILAGLNDPQLMGKKAAMEKKLKKESQAVAEGNDYWQQLAEAYDPIEEIFAERVLISPSPLSGAAVIAAHAFYDYYQAKEVDASGEELSQLKGRLEAAIDAMQGPNGILYLATVLGELKEFADPGDTYITDFLSGRSPEQAAKEVIGETRLDEEKKLKKLLKAKPKKMRKSKDPLARLAFAIVPEFQEAIRIFTAQRAQRLALQEKIANEVYQVFGNTIPPDATFTLRLADGIVKGYDYNGTKAPYKTTYFGMYDRYYANDGEDPWSLPKRWLTPSPELLRSPLNLVSTCDSTGGASGSPMINKKGEMVALLFDGNIESLPGDFIYDPSVNRSVAVHLGGVVAAMKYIYRTQSILEEIGVE